MTKAPPEIESSLSLENCKTFVFVLIPDFSLMAFSTAIDPLRIANRQVGEKVYHWRVVSADGEPVKASNGVTVSVDGSIEDERKRLFSLERNDMTIVCSGVRIEQFNHKALNAWLRSLANRKIPIGGLCTGAWILASAGLLYGKRCAIHWENLPAFAEKFPEVIPFSNLFEIDDGIYTCAGGISSLDLMMHIISADHNDSIIKRICEQSLSDRVRNPHDRQRLPLRARLGVQSTKLLTIIEMMESNISDPLSLVETSKRVGLSRRQIERLFQKNLGRSPARYYLDIRLDRARHLLMQSTLPIVEIAVACGFVSASHFSKCYRELYGRSPQAERHDYEKIAAE